MTSDGYFDDTPVAAELDSETKKRFAEEQPWKDEPRTPLRPLRRKKSSFDLRDVFQHHEREVAEPEQKGIHTSLHKAENPERSSLTDEQLGDGPNKTSSTLARSD